jgi:hypothetical protein
MASMSTKATQVKRNLTRRVTDTSLCPPENLMALAQSRRGLLGDTVHLNIIRYYDTLLENTRYHIETRHGGG